MRCSFCQSYIPEGISSSQGTLQCPQCGRAPASPSVEEKKELADTASIEAPSAPKTFFANFFTIACTLGLGEASTRDISTSPGSLSFGEQGFSLVANAGKTWQRFPYRDLRSTQLHDDGVVLSLHSANHSAPNEVKIVVQASNGLLPGKKNRARALYDLLTRVQAGLTSTEIEFFQRALS